MISILASVLAMSLVLSIVCRGAFFLRSRMFSGREGMMYPFWVIILIISMLPFRLPVENSAVNEYSAVVDEPMLVASGIFTHRESGVVTPDGVFIPAEGEYDAFFADFERGVRMTLAGSAQTIEDVCSVIVVLWAVGAAIAVFRAVYRYTKAKRLLYVNSHASSDPRVIALTEKICGELSIRRRVSVRQTDVDGIASPCVVSVFSPVLYIDSYCAQMEEEQLRCIITHELIHIKRFDIVAKMLCVAATSVHWFNPDARRVFDAMLEDCELSCDHRVIRHCGADVGSLYMNAIIDIAQRYSMGCVRSMPTECAAGMFAALNSGRDFLKRRYKNMKNHKRDRVSMMYASLFCAIAFLANAFALSGCVDLNKAEFESAIVLSEPLNTVVRAYYNLDSDDAIKPEMLDNITSIAVSTYEWDDRLYYEYTVNHNYDMTVSALPKMVRANYFENVILPTLEEKGSGVSYYRFQAFYSLLDLNAEDLDEREREELIAEYPIITEVDAFYLLDPYVSDRETALLRSNIYDAKLDEPFLLDPRGIDRETLGYFKNLSEIIYVE